MKALYQICEQSCELNLKSMKYKITEEIVSIFNIMFENDFKEQLDPGIIEFALKIPKAIFTSMNSTEKSYTNKNPAKLLYEEKGIFAFIEKLGYLFKNDARLEKYIIDDFMTYSTKDPHQEAYCRRSMVCMYNLIVQGCITDEEVLCEIIPQLESRLMHFVNLRYYTEEASMLVKCAQDLKTNTNHFPNLLFVSGCIWLHIARYLINPKAYKEQIFNNEHEDIDENKQYDKTGFREFMNDNSAVTSDKFDSEDDNISPVIQDMIYNMVISSLKTKNEHCLFYSKEYSKNLQDDLLKEIESTSMNLDKEILHCIISALLPYCNATGK